MDVKTDGSNFKSQTTPLIDVKKTNEQSKQIVEVFPPLSRPEKLILAAILISMTSTCLLSLSVLSFLPTYIEERNEKHKVDGTFNISKTLTGVIIS